MPLSILIVPDKFKGTLTAGAAANAIARGWHQARPGDRLELLPMSDGGDGFGEVTGELLAAKVQTIRTTDAAHRPLKASWWWDRKTKTAVIESAGVIGLAMLPPKKFHPFELDTFGLGPVIRAAAAKGAKRCLIGIGGSATNDGGFGVVRALGWKFLDRAGKAIERWTNLHALATIRAPQHRRWFEEFIVAVDVRNPLLGQRGATRVYGPQKSLRPSEFVRAEKSLRQLARIGGGDHALTPGTGAAGGLGFGLLAFLGARLEPGFDLFARFAKLDLHIRSKDLVITGEGSVDRSTFMGKGIGQIAQRCRKSGIPCIALAGTIQNTTQTRRAFMHAHSLTNLTTLLNATARPALWLERLAESAATEFKL